MWFVKERGRGGKDHVKGTLFIAKRGEGDKCGQIMLIAQPNPELGSPGLLSSKKSVKNNDNDAFECFLGQLHPRMTVRLFGKAIVSI